jgi:hypothetical protein
MDKAVGGAAAAVRVEIGGAAAGEKKREVDDGNNGWWGMGADKCRGREDNDDVEEDGWRGYARRGAADSTETTLTDTGEGDGGNSESEDGPSGGRRWEVRKVAMAAMMIASTLAAGGRV